MPFGVPIYIIISVPVWRKFRAAGTINEDFTLPFSVCSPTEQMDGTMFRFQQISENWEPQPTAQCTQK
jgi:hypothetical protein